MALGQSHFLLPIAYSLLPEINMLQNIIFEIIFSAGPTIFVVKLKRHLL